MGIADAWASGKRSDVQTPERSDVQAPKRLDIVTPKRPDAQTAGRLGAATARRPELALQGTAKSKHPDYGKNTLYIRKSTMRDALRRYEDQGGVEMSELVERLLREYVKGGFHG